MPWPTPNSAHARPMSKSVSTSVDPSDFSLDQFRLRLRDSFASFSSHGHTSSYAIRMDRRVLTSAAASFQARGRQSSQTKRRGPPPASPIPRFAWAPRGISLLALRAAGRHRQHHVLEGEDALERVVLHRLLDPLALLLQRACAAFFSRSSTFSVAASATETASSRMVRTRFETGTRRLSAKRFSSRSSTAGTRVWSTRSFFASLPFRPRRACRRLGGSGSACHAVIHTSRCITRQGRLTDQTGSPERDAPPARRG